MGFVPSTCKSLVQDPLASSHNLVNCEPIQLKNQFTYLGSVISSSRLSSEGIGARIHKTWKDYANTNHLWQQYDVDVMFEVKVYSATVGFILLYRLEVWALHVQYVKRLSVFGHRRSWTISNVKSEDRTRNPEVIERLFRDNPNIW